MASNVSESSMINQQSFHSLCFLLCIYPIPLLHCSSFQPYLFYLSENNFIFHLTEKIEANRQKLPQYFVCLPTLVTCRVYVHSPSSFILLRMPPAPPKAKTFDFRRNIHTQNQSILKQRCNIALPYLFIHITPWAIAFSPSSEVRVEEKKK